MNKYMTLQVESFDEIPVIGLLMTEIRTDSHVARIQEELQSVLSDQPTEKLIVDMSAVHFMSSTGLRVLIFLRRHFAENGGVFKTVVTHDHLKEVFRTTRLSTEGLDMFGSVEEAATSIKNPEPQS